MLTVVAILGYLGILTLGSALLWRYRSGSPLVWFQFALALMALGVFPHIVWSSAADREYVWVTFLAHIVFLVATLATADIVKMKPLYARYELKDLTRSKPDVIPVLWAIFVVSSIITAIYYYAVGYNVLVLLISGEEFDYSSMRLEAYSGDQYFAPGYVNQFKNILLPLSALLLSITMFKRGSPRRATAFSGAAFLWILLALGGTGQRTFIVYTAASCAFGYFLDQVGRGTRASKFKLAIALAPVLLLFLFMTAFYADQGDASSLQVALSRFTSIQQEGALFAFEYIHSLPITWFGDWAKAVVGILPGVEGSTLAHDIYGALYGTTRGTAPPSSIGSAYYNGGEIGVVILFSLLGIVYTALYRRFLNGPKNVYRSYGYGFLFFNLSIFVTDSPVILLDNGVVALALFLALMKWTRESEAIAPNARVATTRPVAA